MKMGETIREIISSCPGCEEFVAASVIGTILALGIVFVIVIVFGVYIYSSLARMAIARKLGHKMPWLAWIPFARTSLILQLGGFHWAWVFLVLLPILGWIALGILMIISFWKIFEKRKYPGWLALILLLVTVPSVGWLANLAFLIVIGFVAWQDR